MYKKIGG